MPDRITKIRVSLKNYQHNLSVIRSIVGEDVKIMAVVKANAYGHGIEAIARAAIESEASYLGMVSIGELKRVRAAGIVAPCLLLNYLDKESISDAVVLDTAVTAMDADFITALQDVAQSVQKNVNVHLKIDTGMHRAGCVPSEAHKLAKQIYDAPNLTLEGVFTHFAESEDPDSNYTVLQIKCFIETVEKIKTSGIKVPLVHCANSAATIAHPAAHFDMVRPGIVTYGINPFPNTHESQIFVESAFKPVLTITSQIAYVRELAVGETVGYNRRWKAERPSKVALVPIGYGDGYRRTPNNAGFMLVHGQKVPIVGTVSMDQTMVDVTEVKGAAVDDDVVILGDQKAARISVDDIAAAYGTINYEVVTALTDRLERI